MQALKTWTLTTLTLLALAALLIPGLATADSEDGETHFAVVAGDAGKAEFEIKDLKVGETRTFKTDEGKPVTVTRTEDGYDLDVDGKKIVVSTEGISGEGFQVRTRHGEGGEGHEVVVLKDGEGEGEGHSVVVLSGDEGHEGARVITKRIVAGEGGEGKRIEVRVVTGDEDFDLEGMEAIDVGGTQILVIQDEEGGEEGGEGERVVVKVKKKVEKKE